MEHAPRLTRLAEHLLKVKRESVHSRGRNRWGPTLSKEGAADLTVDAVGGRILILKAILYGFR